MPDGVIFYRYSPPAAGRSAYLLIDLQSQTAAAVDPLGDMDVFLEDAWTHGARIKHVFLTCLRNDVETDALVLTDRACATIYAGAWARRNAPYMLLKDGDTFEFGRVRLRVLETPGHRLESIVLVLSDLRTEVRSPLAALTGETVLIGDIGRPDAQPSDGFGPGDLAGMLYVSLRTKVFGLPDSARIFPSLESDVEIPADRPETIGAQRQHNPGFQPMSRAEFVDRVSLAMTEERSLRMSRGGRPEALDLAELLQAQRDGAQVVDDRDPLEFAAAHVAGSMNIPDAAAFDSWVAGIVDPQRPIVLVTEPGRERELSTRLARAGLPRALGFLDGGRRSFRDSPEAIRRSVRRGVVSLKDSCEKRLILDTRPSQEKPLGPSVGGFGLPLGLLRGEVDALPREREILVCDDFPCRSSAAASFLRSRGFENVAEIGGGLALWGLGRGFAASSR